MPKTDFDTFISTYQPPRHPPVALTLGKMRAGDQWGIDATDPTVRIETLRASVSQYGKRTARKFSVHQLVDEDVIIVVCRDGEPDPF